MLQAAAEQVHGTVHEQQAGVQQDEQNTEDILYKGAEKHNGEESDKSFDGWAGGHFQPTWRVSKINSIISTHPIYHHLKYHTVHVDREVPDFLTGEDGPITDIDLPSEQQGVARPQ